jgi:hypothetical protein
MNNKDLNKTLTYREMQELLPDYVFCRINPDDRTAFEKNLPAYPDLIDEIKQVREVFSKVEAMDIDKIIEAKTRNLSVRVKDRRSKHRKVTTYSWTMKYAVPTVAILFLGFYIFINKDNLDVDSSKNQVISKLNNSNDKSDQLLTKADADLLFAEGVSLEDLNHIYTDYSLASNYSDITAYVTEDDKTIDNIYYEQLANQLKDLKSNEINHIYKNDINSLNGMFNELENLDESQIQSLIEDVKNVRI